jgi:hypothetical protein
MQNITEQTKYKLWEIFFVVLGKNEDVVIVNANYNVSLIFVATEKTCIFSLLKFRI